MRRIASNEASSINQSNTVAARATCTATAVSIHFAIALTHRGARVPAVVQARPLPPPAAAARAATAVSSVAAGNCRHPHHHLLGTQPPLLGGLAAVWGGGDGRRQKFSAPLPGAPPSGSRARTYDPPPAAPASPPLLLPFRSHLPPVPSPSLRPLLIPVGPPRPTAFTAPRAAWRPARGWGAR